MAFDIARLENPHNGRIREAPIGFSWTMFFFGIFPPLFRGDWKWFLILLVAALMAAPFTFGFGGLVPSVIGAFFWNKSYCNRLLNEGYQITSSRKSKVEKIERYLGRTVPKMRVSP